MNNKSTVRKILMFLSVLLLMAVMAVPCCFAADADFEKSISTFPESYKPALRALHEKHPEWSFTPLFTGVDWDSAVTAEYKDDISLVINDSAYTDLFKSRESGDFDFTTGKYIVKDYGFVKANKLAISYYMDPRNFLNEEGIFQFEDFSFSNTITVESVEHVLEGSFMANKNISYLDKDGNTVKTNEKYSQVIFQAGKLYNTNPCFLAAKIISEVGKSGSGSVSGKYGSYPGIYNFYNIGANDNPSGAIENGLKWASTGSTYQRPWNTPKKSIIGGAQYIAEKYISKGQHTSYLQRFNVNPNASYPLFTHQYMTNISGAAIPAYSNYIAYRNAGMLDLAFRFLIPVYQNIPGNSSTDGYIKAADSYNQQGTFSTANNSYNVRKGPSTSNDKYSFTVAAGTAVKILDNVFTDSRYYDSIMRYPYWRNISFTSGSTSYTGYVYSNFISLSTYTVVPVGTYTPVTFKNNAELSLKYISSDPSIATVVNDRSIKFLKAGTVEITAYDSIGNYQVIKYKVVDNATQYSIKNVGIIEDENGNINVCFDKNSNYNYYEVYLTDSMNKPVKSTVVSTNTAVFKGLNVSQSLKAYVRGLYKSGNTKRYSIFANPVTLVLNPPVPVGVTAAQNGYHGVKVSWNKVNGAAGYEVYSQDSKGNYTLLGSASGSATYYLDNSRNLIDGATYCVRAFMKSDTGGKVYSEYSDKAIFTPVDITVEAVSGLRQKQTTTTGYTLYWNAVDDVDSYEIYRYNASSKSYELSGTCSEAEYAVTGLTPSGTARYKVRAVVNAFSNIYYSEFSSYLIAETCPDKVTKLAQTSTTATSYRLKWNAVINADGYRIYRYDSKTKAYVKLADTTGTYYDVSSLSASRKDTYRVRAFSKTTSGAVFGTYVSYTASTCPAAVASFKQKSTTTTSYTLYWSSVTNATGYRVYRYDSKKRAYVKLADTKNTYYKISSLSVGKSAKYKVRAYTTTPNGSVFGATVSYTASTRPAAVSSIKQLSTTTTGYTLSWNKVPNATGYRVYRYDSKQKKYISLKAVSGNSIKITGKKPGQSDIYKVRAYTKTASGNVYSSYSSSFTAKAKK